MSLTELEKEVENLDSSDFEAFTKWIDAYAAKRWDAQFEQDVAAGKLDKLGKKADLAFESGQWEKKEKRASSGFGLELMPNTTNS